MTVIDMVKQKTKSGYQFVAGNVQNALAMGTKGMQAGDLFGFVTLLIMVAFALGIGIYSLAVFMDADGVSTNVEAVAGINGTLQAIKSIGVTYMPLIVTIAMLTIVMGMVISGFAFYRNRR
jgi:hypothetical protein